MNVLTLANVYFYGCLAGFYLLKFYRGADKSLARPTSQCTLFYGENISFDASLYLYIVLIFLQL